MKINYLLCLELMVKTIEVKEMMKKAMEVKLMVWLKGEMIYLPC
jgi:hypothetical protein